MTPLITRRTKAYPTQRAMAAALGMNPPAYCDIERGRVLPTVETLRRMCQLLGCGPLDLYDLTDIDLTHCGKEDEMSITQETRRESYHATNTATRQKIIVWAFERYGSMTARECASVLSYQDLNAVKPRITELCRMDKLEAVGKRKDPATDRNVAVFRVKEDKPHG